MNDLHKHVEDISSEKKIKLQNAHQIQCRLQKEIDALISASSKEPTDFCSSILGEIEPCTNRLAIMVNKEKRWAQVNDDLLIMQSKLKTSTEQHEEMETLMRSAATKIEWQENQLGTLAASLEHLSQLSERDRTETADRRGAWMG